MEANEFWRQSSESTNKAVEKIKTGIQKYLIFIVLIFNISLEIAVKCFRIGLNNVFTASFFVNLTISISTSMLCYICFIPLGRTDEEKRSLTYESTIKKWESLSNKVRDGFIELFKQFCISEVDEERTEQKKMILANNTIIPYDTYKTEYEGKSKEELKALYKEGIISKEEFKALKRCNKVKAKPINPLIILCGTKRTSINDAGRDEGSYALTKTLQRPVIMFVISFVVNSISTTFIGGDNNVILDIMLSIFSIVVASVCGYTTGTNDFKHHEDRVKSRTVFLTLFCQKNNI